MMERGDLTVVHEPFSNRAAQGWFSVGGRRFGTDPELLGAILDLAADGPVFVKDTTDYAYPDLLADDRLLHGVTNTFIIRDPAEAIASHHAMNPAVTRDDIGFERCWTMFRAVLDATGTAPVVVDDTDLLRRPAELVAAYCARVGLPFVPEALAWQPGARDEWRRTEAWHRGAEKSTGIQARSQEYGTTVRNDERLAGYDRYHRPFYEKLRAYRLSV